MDALVDATARVVAERGSRLVTVAEVSHFSRTSHEFHFKLLRRLHEDGSFDCFASERLGALDAVFMNAWLAGDLGDMGLDELYADVLPFGGLGTRMWMRYFKTTKRPFRLLGLAPDSLDVIEDRQAAAMKAALRKVSALELVTTKTAYDGFVSLSCARATPSPSKPYDVEILRAFALASTKPSWPAFRDAWSREIARAFREHGNLFVNGYHLARGGPLNVGQRFPARARPLCFGMGAAVHERECSFVDEAWLARQGILASDFAASNAAARKAWANKSPKEYRALFATKRLSPVVFPGAPRGHVLLKVDGDANMPPGFNAWGAEPYPVLRGASVPPFDDGDLTASMFDYVAFVPRSRWTKRFN